MFVDDGHDKAEDATCDPGEVAVPALLAACASEAERQAEGLRQLDAALGAALVAARRQTDPRREMRLHDGQFRDGGVLQGQELDERALVSALTADLQTTDRLRQEAEGLARILALIAGKPDRAGFLSTAEIRACTPLSAMRRRLLLPVTTR